MGSQVRVLLLPPFGPVVQLVRTPACHAGGRQFEPVPGRHIFSIEKISADIAQSVERILGKDEVASSNLASSSKALENAWFSRAFACL